MLIYRKTADSDRSNLKMFSISSILSAAFWTQSHNYTWTTPGLHRGVCQAKLDLTPGRAENHVLKLGRLGSDSMGFKASNSSR